MENYMFVMLWNLSVISHWIFPQYLFYTPVEDGTYYGITHGVQVGGQVGWWAHPHSLSGAYLQDYASYGYEIS